ncbi:MAG: hypothetical protein ABI699_00690 [Caldimonas sp.]
MNARRDPPTTSLARSAGGARKTVDQLVAPAGPGRLLVGTIFTPYFLSKPSTEAIAEAQSGAG